MRKFDHKRIKHDLDYIFLDQMFWSDEKSKANQYHTLLWFQSEGGLFGELTQTLMSEVAVATPAIWLMPLQILSFSLP